MIAITSSKIREVCAGRLSRRRCTQVRRRRIVVRAPGRKTQKSGPKGPLSFDSVESVDQLLIELATVLNLLAAEPPSSEMAAMHTTAIRATSSAYSTRLAPFSSLAMVNLACR